MFDFGIDNNSAISISKMFLYLEDFFQCMFELDLHKCDDQLLKTSKLRIDLMGTL